MTIIRPFGRVDRKLNVGPAGLDPDLADDSAREVAHPLVFLVGQRQRRRDGNAVAGVDAHRIDVLDRADDDEVVGAVAHDLELELFPADHRLFEQHLVDRAEIEPAAGELAELLDVVGNSCADAAERERRPDDARKAELLDDAKGFLDRLDVSALGDIGANRTHGVAKQQPVLRNLDRGHRGANQLDAVLLERAVLSERDGQVERRLPADGRQNRIGLLAFDDGCEDFGRERLDVGAVGELGVGHDRRGIAVDEDDLETLVAQRLAGLRPGIVELAGLADDDRARADDEYAFDVGSFGHGEIVGSGLKAQGSGKSSETRSRRFLPEP